MTIFDKAGCLEQVLNDKACLELQAFVQIKSLLVDLTDRLSNPLKELYAASQQVMSSIVLEMGSSIIPSICFFGVS